ncbi:hypothetical protein Tco_1111936 [Tanacetum coccineum]|uniref:Uncharacterized protein n=1 Tax=Tanacetum coccineum TaxID=301880 RepID=A0ABQ5IN46_9ASTR
MNTTQAQQKALDDALVAPADRLEFGKCNMRLKTDIKPKKLHFKSCWMLLLSLLSTDKSLFALKFQDKSLKTSHWNKTFSLSSEILDTLLNTYINHGEHLLSSSTSV